MRNQMEAYAVIETGGKQYRVQKDDVVAVELLDGVEAGQAVEFGRVLAVNDGSGLNVGMGKDYTLFALKDGVVSFDREGKRVNVQPVANG